MGRSDAFLFPASGPAFITGQRVDEKLREYVNMRRAREEKLTWLIGSSTGSLRALSIFYNNSTKPIADAYKEMVWYPWSTPSILGNLMETNIQLPYKDREKGLIDRPSNVVPVVLVSYSYLPPLLAIVLSILCSLVGYHGLIYKLAELHIYMPAWAPFDGFPLVFNKQIRCRIKVLSSDNLDRVLYSSCRLPFLMRSNGPGCDGVLLHGYLNARAAEGTRLTLIGDVPIEAMTRAFTDWRPIEVSGSGCKVIAGRSTVSILDWFNPFYVIWPHLRIAKWAGKRE